MRNSRTNSAAMMKNMTSTRGRLMKRTITNTTRAAACIAAIAISASTAFAQTFPGTAIPTDPFEVHGLLYSGSAPGGFLMGDAWAQGSSFYGVLDENGMPAIGPDGNPFRASRQVDPNWGNQGDGSDPTLFAGGNKNDFLIGPGDSPWDWNGGGGGPQKNDLTNAYFHTRVDPVTGDRWVFVGAETRSTNGDSHVDFEFNQAGVVKTGETEGFIVGMGPDGGRTINDFLVSVDFGNGGENPVASVRTWDGTQFIETMVPGMVFSATNFDDISHGAGGTWKHFASDGAEVNLLTGLQLVEAGLNLTGLGIDVDPCSTDATFTAKTRSSGSWTADLKDFAIVSFPLEPMPELEVSAPENVCTQTEFEVSVTEMTGLPNTSFDWEVTGCGSIVGSSTGESIVVTSGETCGCNIDITVTTTAGDCAHVKSLTVNVSVGDENGPTLSSEPADATVECDAIPQAAEVTAEDNCAAGPVEFTEETTAGECAGESFIERTWTATDDCGNVTDHTQALQVVDTTAPQLSGVPGDNTVSCDAIPMPAEVSASDNCSEVEVVLNESDEMGDCFGRGTITRTWTATDACGNEASETQILTVVDEDAPTLIGVPDDATYECDSLPAPANVTAEDNCSQVGVELEEVTTPGECIGESTVARTWTATDECGNDASQTQAITLIDTTAPELVGVPADATVECSDIPEPAVVTATDNCSDPVVTFEETLLPGEGAGKATITRTWTATDDCGNETSATQRLIVIDTTAPELVGVPGDITAECDAVPAPADVTATDNCATPGVSLDEVVTEGGCDGSRTITRTWTAVDDCGNETSGTQVITVVDTTAPVFDSAPADFTAECDDVPAPETLTASDNCSNVDIDFMEVSEPGDCEGSSTITRTWTATDACGNATDHVQIVTVVDTTAPTLSDDPADVTAECDSVPNQKTLTASDNCDSGVTVVPNEAREDGACPFDYTLLRTWSAADACGNEVSADQTVTVRDTTAPKISLSGSPTKFICDGAPVSFAFNTNDNCSAVDLEMGGITFITSSSQDRINITQTGDGTARITATGPAWITGSLSAVDECGNDAEPFELRLFAKIGREACSQGFWKNHFNRWGPSGYSPDDLFVAAFEITDFSNPQIASNFTKLETLADALSMTGGDFNQAQVQGTAALLNAAHPLVDFPLTETEVKQTMQAAFAGVISFSEAVQMFNFGNDAEKECGCPVQ